MKEVFQFQILVILQTERNLIYSYKPRSLLVLSWNRMLTTKKFGQPSLKLFYECFQRMTTSKDGNLAL